MPQETKTTSAKKSSLAVAQYVKSSGISQPAVVSAMQSQQGTFTGESIRAAHSFDNFQMKSAPENTINSESPVPFQLKRNNTGLPDKLKSGVESLSGFSMDDVKVHYNSEKPAQLQALAYAQGADIHIGPGQEKHLAHEAWHVVQQKQGRVRPTLQMKGETMINDNKELEAEADIMGQKALQGPHINHDQGLIQANTAGRTVQRRLGFEFETGYTVKVDDVPLTKKTAIGSLRGRNWKVEADDDGRMEFIIYPPLEIDNTLTGTINAIFSEIELLCGNLKVSANQNRTAVPVQVEEEEESPPPQHSEEVETEDQDIQDVDQEEDDSGSEIDLTEYTYHAFPLSDVTGSHDDHPFTVYPNTDEIAANPQVTTGLTLDQLFNMKDVPIDDASPAKWAVEGVQGRIGAVSANIPDNLSAFGYNDAPSDKLKGLLTIICHYLTGGNQQVPFSYPKELTDSLALSRTNVSQLFQLITHYERVYFTANPQQFVNLCLSAANMSNTGAFQVLTPGVMVHGVPTPFGPTRFNWLINLPQGIDLLSRSQDQSFESMGELGNKVEYVGSASGNLLASGGIFELRAGQTRSLEYSEWRQYALDLAGFIKTFQKDNAGILKDLNKKK